MITKKTPLLSVPTHVITGFLGVGKSSVILELLNNKPKDERWAILVNEFGEIGVDGSLFEGQYRSTKGVFISEVPGGCMCCAAGVPMQIALNQLLRQAKPDRLLIEPTGLGHPKEILQVLSGPHYKKVLLLQKTVTLVDARKLVDQRYTSHEIFNQQIAIADIVLGNKADLYQAGDKQRLLNYVKATSQASTQVIFSDQGDVSLAQLQGSASIKPSSVKPHHHHAINKQALSEMIIPACGFIKAVNSGEGFESVGWRFSASTIFNYTQIASFLSALKVERIKAVLNTNEGVFSFNMSDKTLTEKSLKHCHESRIEIINRQLEQTLEQQLMACICS